MKKVFTAWFWAMLGAILATLVVAMRRISMNKTLNEIMTDFGQVFKAHSPAYIMLLVALVVAVVVLFFGKRPPED